VSALGPRRTPLWLALYALGLLCVLSFVFFEVLDVDGSDFDPTPSRVAIKLAETPHEFRRGFLGHLQGVAALVAPLATDLAAPPTAPTTLEARTRRGVPIAPAARARAALPRALLSDVPPSA
jgi:hypothetical protein